jgi:7,8-dihydropterin-6-yl-methyl-4-(beta-D-ribofuranosyl)aminobenzene 5'-phosphate synthase
MTMNRRMIADQARIPGSGVLISIALLFLLWGLLDKATAQTSQHQIQRFKITILSTMLVGDTTGIGEWGFAALVDVDGHRMLLDTGAHPDAVIRNAHDLHVDLSDVQEVILTHYHWDHVGGLLTLRRELMKDNPKALPLSTYQTASSTAVRRKPASATR